MTPTPANRRHIRRALLAWLRSDGLRAPWRDSGDPYQALVAAVMAQQTQMSRVMPSYERFVAAFPTVETLAAASLGDVIRVWKGMGYNQRAVRLHRAARTIAANGWPNDAAALGEIDGIGPFTAAIIASFAFGQSAACVDTNVVRVLTRLTGDDTLRGKRLQQLADTLIPAAEPARWNQALMDYGARVCGTRPKCGECVVSRWCASRDRFAGGGAVVAAAVRLVAEEKAEYRVRARQPKFEETPRYFRGRIIDALRDLPSGESVTLSVLRSRIARTAVTPSPDEVRGWVEGLEQAGLCVLRRGRVSLPA
jgi:A/G-specific adenine glycosylase